MNPTKDELIKQTMKDTPILFTGPNVNLIFGDLKTKTRRIMNVEPTATWASGNPKLLTVKMHEGRTFACYA